MLQTRPRGGWVWIDTLPHPPAPVREALQPDRGIVSWMPLVWTARIALLILLLAAVVFAVLLLVRLLRWSTMRLIVAGKLPPLRKAGATAKLLGGEAGVDLEFVQAVNAFDAAIKTDKERLMDLEERVRALIAFADRAKVLLAKLESEDVEDSAGDGGAAGEGQGRP